MSIDILFELQQELRRLFIAGSKLATGDMRLQRMLARLDKLGEAAPVFKRMSQGVQEVIEARPQDTAGKLLELGTLLSSVLYTQGRTETPGELKVIEGSEFNPSTTVPYRKLQPLRQALTQKGMGRTEQVVQGYEDQLFHDFRVIPIAVAALDDTYNEIAEFIQQKVIPAYGEQVLPALRQQLNLDGKKGDARRLELIYTLSPDEKVDTLLMAATEGSPEVRAAAIQLLGNYVEQEDFILEQADDKKKEIRIAALFALSRLGTEAAIDRLRRALHSKDQEIAIQPIRECESSSLKQYLMIDGQKAAESVIQGEKPEHALQLLLAVLSALRGTQEQGTVEFLAGLLSNPAFITRETESAQDKAADLLLELKMPEADQFLMTLQEQYNRKFIGYSLRAAVRSCSPEEVYERFHHEFKTKRHGVTKTLLHELNRLVPNMYVQLESWEKNQEPLTRWDPRWLPLLMELDEEELVYRMVAEPDEQVISYLTAKCEGAPEFDRITTVYMLLTLFYLQAANAPALTMKVLENSRKKRLYYMNHFQLTLLNLMPGSYADGIKEFAETVSNSNVKEQLIEIAESLAGKNQ